MRTTPVVLAAICLAMGAVAIARSPVAGRARAADVTDAVNLALGLRASTLQPLVFEMPGNGRVTTRVTFAGELRTLELAPHSVRSAAYEVRAQQADGSWVTVAPSPIRTLRGTVPGLPGAVVAGSRLDDGLYATVRLPGGRRYWIEPVAPHVGGVAADLHAVYEQADVLPGGGSCAAEIDEAGGIFLPPGDRREYAAGGFEGDDDICVAELACDTDVEFYEDHNSSIPDVEARINVVINIANLQFEAEVAITHALTTILVRTAEPDPYTETAPGPLLDQFRDQWNAYHTDIERDAAQLFTGKDLDGTVVGFAYVGSLCGELGYSIVESDYSGFACSTDLSAHELGHTWGAPHCPCQLPPYTMNSIITCANRFSAVTQIIIEQFRDRQPCIFCQPSIQFSFPLGLPQVVSHEGGTIVQVMVQPGLSDPESDTTQLHLIINDGPVVSFPTTEVSKDVYEATFPSFDCADVIGYFFSVETTDMVTVRSPLDAPNESYPALAGSQILSRFADDFELDQSWTVTDAGLTDGSWERGVPIALTVCDRGNPNGDGDGSGSCYLTDNDPNDCDSDVDGGSTTLTSPAMDASGQGIALISYDRWYDNTGSGQGPNPFEDSLPVEVSDDDGASWLPLETVGPFGAVTGGWTKKVWKLTDAGLAQTGQFRIRFVAQDVAGESTVEAAVDGVELRMVICCLWDLDGDGTVGINDFLDLLSQWGTNPAGPPDFDGDGTVGINDFLELLANWGDCP